MKKYIKNGKECILCHIRKKLIQITPEEIVRQNFVNRLINDYGVPPSLIDIEVSLAHYKKGLRRRADIIVSEYEDKTHYKIPLIIIECKAPLVPLVDKVFDQVADYDSDIMAKIIVTTNGDETNYYSWNEEKEEYLDIKDIPIFSDLINGKGIELISEIEQDWKRPNHKENVKINRKLLLEQGNIGEDTNENLVPLITNLTGLIYDEDETTNNLPLLNKNFIEDGGIRYTTFGNSSGGGWTGYYRYFIVENENKETEIVSIALMGKESAKTHSKFGKSNGYSMFNIAIDDYKNSHLSLQYSIDRYVKQKLSKYSFWHDGTLTVGNLGRAKNKDVIDFIKVDSPHLIKNNKIYLGILDNSIPFEWGNNDVKKLIANFIDYGFARDKFRQIRKKAITQQRTVEKNK